MGIFDHTLPKSADAQLDHGSVVQDLGRSKKQTDGKFPDLRFILAPQQVLSLFSAHLYGRVSVLDVVLQVAHQHQVAGLVPA